MSGRVIDVVPSGIDEWQVQCSDGRHHWRAFRDKGEAIALAKQIAINSAGCMVIHGKDGEIQTLRSFDRGGRAYVS